MAEKSFPLENTLYTAEDAQLWMATRTSGVYASDDLTLTANGSLVLTLGAGQAWLKYGRFKGCAYANTANMTFTAELSDSKYDRIDRFCIRVEPQNSKCYAYIKTGTPAERPVAPELQRDSAAYEICLYEIAVRVGATGINAGDITDKRLDENLCGLMRDGVTHIDTSVINAQVTELVEELRANLQGMYTGLEKVNIITASGMLKVDDWYGGDDGPIQQVIVNNILPSDDPFVDVDMSGTVTFNQQRELRDAWDCIMSAKTETGIIRFTASEKPLIDIPFKVKVVR